MLDFGLFGVVISMALRVRGVLWVLVSASVIVIASVSATLSVGERLPSAVPLPSWGW